MSIWIIRKLPILVSILLLQGLLFAPPGRSEDIYSRKITVKIKINPFSHLMINKEAIEKILAEYEGHLRGIALRECARERVAQFRLTNIEGWTYTELMTVE